MQNFEEEPLAALGVQHTSSSNLLTQSLEQKRHQSVDTRRSRPTYHPRRLSSGGPRLGHLHTMARAFGIACSKGFLVIYNFLFLVTGFIVLVGGLWLHFDTSLVSFLRILESAPTGGSQLDTFASVLIGMGAFIVIISFLGCCGACCESMCMLCSYSALLFLVLLLETIGAVVFGLHKHKLDGYIEKTMRVQIRTEYNRTLNSTDFVTKAWDRMQIELKCCGSTGPQDYMYSRWYNQSHGKGNFVPVTCCYLTNNSPDYPMVLDENQCQIDAILILDVIKISESLKTRGCHDALMDALHKQASLFIVLAIIVGILQIAGFVFSCILMAAIRREQTKYPWYNDDEDE